jgi:hypothetical protein
MGRARLSASCCPRLSPGQAILLQLGRFMGRRDAARVASGRGALIALKQKLESRAPNRERPVLLYFFGDGGAAGLGAFGEPAGAGVGAGLASISSTSKIRVEFAPISGPTDLSP